jgi:phosphopentomutase
MARALLLVLDSFGIGFAKDADEFDRGSNTLGNIAKQCDVGDANNADRQGALTLPHLCQLGLNEALKLSSGSYGAGLPIGQPLTGSYGYAIEQSAGKDTPSGHWEMAGLPVHEDWGYFSSKENCFPEELLQAFIDETTIPGVLGNCHASGTEIIERLGEEHIQSGKPIVYTSADSVFQIAAHEIHFGLDRLYELCDITRKLVDPYRIGRVIARPFLGESSQEFKRTSNRRDIATPPFDKTLLDYLVQAEREVITVGKVGDIFAHRGITQEYKTKGNDHGVELLLEQMDVAPEGALIFANLNDFDTEFGHRRNVAGYANALEIFDQQLPSIIAAMRPDDIAIIAADHGCDPTWGGTDHTREHIPVLLFGPGVSANNLGARQTFADIGQTIAGHLSLSPLAAGLDMLGSE